MYRMLWGVVFLLTINACANMGEGSKTQMYGEIKSGVEYTRIH